VIREPPGYSSSLTESLAQFIDLAEDLGPKPHHKEHSWHGNDCEQDDVDHGATIRLSATDRPRKCRSSPSGSASIRAPKRRASHRLRGAGSFRDASAAGTLPRR